MVSSKMVERLTNTDYELKLLSDFPDVLREFSSKGLVIVHENGIFVTNGASEAWNTLHEIDVECSLHEWIMVT